MPLRVSFVQRGTERTGACKDSEKHCRYIEVCYRDREEVALAETIHHHGQFMAATGEAPGWTSDFRALIGAIDRDLHDVNAVPEVLHPTDYAASQAEGAVRRAAGSDGLVWNSVRMPGGQCIGVFWPDVVTIPVQGAHFCYHWNGTRVDFVKRYGTGEILEVR